MKKSINNIIRSPKNNIPIGQPLINPDGTICLTIKKPGSNVYEDVPLDYIMTQACTKAKPPQ